MLGQWAVARFAAEIGVFALALDLHLIRMARFASLPAGELHGPGADVIQSAGPIVPHLSELGWHNDAPHQQEGDQADSQQQYDAAQMLRIPEEVLHASGRMQFSGLALSD